MSPTQPWIQQLSQLRARGLKLRARPEPGALGRLADEALAACAELLDDLGQLQAQCERMSDDTRAAIGAYKRLFDIVPCACVITDRQGTILHANGAASRLLNVAGKRLAGRELLLYSQDRAAFLRLLSNLPTGESAHSLPVVIRPRERRPVEITLTVTPVSPQHQSRWFWFLVTPLRVPMSEADPQPPDVAA